MVKKRNYTKTVSFSEIENELSEICDDRFTEESGAITNALNDYLTSIPQKNRNILVLRYWKCEPIAEIARKIKTNLNTLKTIDSFFADTPYRLFVPGDTVTSDVGILEYTGLSDTQVFFTITNTTSKDWTMELIMRGYGF